MEKLDSFVGPAADHKTGIPIPVEARKTLTKCCSAPQQLSSLTAGNLGSCMKEEPAVAALGTGVYFQNLSLNPVDCCDHSELQDLFNLATVACEVESSIRHRQLVKKRRTPRSVLWINGIPQNGNCRRGLPATGAAAVKRQRIGSLTGLYTPPWLDKSVQKQDSSVFSKLMSTKICHCSNKAILKFGSEQHNTVVRMTNSCLQPNKCSRIKFSKASKGNKLPSVLSSKPRARMPPGKDTRVQGVAKRILQFVGKGSSAEKFIRGALGNNPDTSKALRLLLAQRKVYRVGDGGRGKAFMYVATPAGLRELDQLKDRGSTNDDAAIRHRPNHYQDGHITLKGNLSASSSPHNELLAPYYPPSDVKTCFPQVVSQSVLQAVLGQNMDMDDH